MDARHALTCSDDELAAYVADLDHEALVDFLAAVDAAEIVEKERPIHMGASALFYAQRIGWPVFPCVARGKRPLTEHGFKDATRDPDLIRDWWARWPDANIGTPTGADGCGYDVIDVDGRTGVRSLAGLKHADCPPDCSTETFCAATGELPTIHARAFTPGSTDGPGWHYYISPTGDGNATAYQAGMDYRGAGGYVIVPPSLGMNGVRYTWLTRPGAAHMTAAEISEETFLQRQLRKKAEREALERPAPTPRTAGTSALTVDASNPRAAAWIEAKVAAQLDEIRSAAEGTRNDTLNRVAYSLGRRVPAYLNEQHIAEQLLLAASDAGLAPREAALTIRSGLNKGKDEPLDVTLTDDPGAGLAGLVDGPVTIQEPRPPVSDAERPDADEQTLSAEEIAERAHQARVYNELVLLRARHDAKHLHGAEIAARTFRPPAYTATLTSELAIPDEPVTYAIDEILPAGGNALLAAQFKAGKTTLVTNLLRAYADSEPFLGRFAVTPGRGRIAIFNYELSAQQYRRWLRAQGIRNTDAVAVLNLRGHRLPLTAASIEDWVVGWLKEQDVTFWIADPFARAATGTDENSNTEVGIWLDTFDVIKERAGVSEAVLPTHTGRAEMEQGQERARGATRLDDWADVRWLMTRDEEDRRFFRATGRDVELPEELLTFDATSHQLRFGGGDRGWVKTRALEQAVLDFINANPGAAIGAIQKGVKGKNEAIESARRCLVSSHKVRVEDGSNNAVKHYANEVQA